MALGWTASGWRKYRAEHYGPWWGVAGELKSQNPQTIFGTVGHYFIELLCLVSFCQLDTNLNIPGIKEAQLRNCLQKIDLWVSLLDYFLNC